MLGRACRSVAGVHEHERGLMVRDVGVHRADDAKFVCHFADMRKEVADRQATLSVLLELPR